MRPRPGFTLLAVDGGFWQWHYRVAVLWQLVLGLWMDYDGANLAMASIRVAEVTTMVDLESWK